MLLGRYGVPASAADAFEEVARQQVYGHALRNEQVHDANSKAHFTLLKKTTMFSPKLLVDAGERHSRSALMRD